MVAMTLKGRRVSESVTLSIAPGSRQVLEMLARNGMLADIIASGARILETGCGPCIGQGQSPADDTVSVRTFNRNFAGRTGTKGDQAYLVSPETAVAIALTGEFTDPRTAGIEYPNVVEPEVFEINDNMIQLPGGSGEIVRKRTIGAPPVNQPLPDELDGVVVIKVGDKITNRPHHAGRHSSEAPQQYSGLCEGRLRVLQRGGQADFRRTGFGGPRFRKSRDYRRPRQLRAGVEPRTCGDLPDVSRREGRRRAGD